MNKKALGARRIGKGVLKLILGTVFSVAMVEQGLATTLESDLDFSTANQAIWSGGDPKFDQVLASTILGANGFGIPNLVADFGLLGQFGVEANITAGVDVGFLTTLRDFNVGTVNVNFPVKVTLDFPTEVTPGQTFSISSSYTVSPTASFASSVTDSKLDLGATAALVAELRMRACAGGCFIDSTDPSSPFYLNENIDLGSFALITQTKDSTILNVDIPDFGQGPALSGKPTIAGSGFDINPAQDATINPLDWALDNAIAEVTNVSGKLGVPDLSQTGGLTGLNTLSGTVTDVFTDIAVDLDSFLTPPAPPLGFGPINVGGVVFGADIFDASLITKLIAQQELSFQGTPMITLDLGAMGTHTFAAGETLDLTFPTGMTQLDITPTYSLDNTFNNRSTVAAAQQTDITFAGLEFAFPKVDVIPGLPPVVIPGTSGFCAVRNPFSGNCVLFVPGTPPITIFPGTDPVSVGPFNFNDAVYKDTITDSIINTSIAGFPLSVGTCDIAPDACNLLPLLSTSGARNSEQFLSSRRLDFDNHTGPGFSILAATSPGSVPEPETLMLILLGFSLIWLTRRNTGRYGQ